MKLMNQLLAPLKLSLQPLSGGRLPRERREIHSLHSAYTLESGDWPEESSKVRQRGERANVISTTGLTFGTIKEKWN